MSAAPLRRSASVVLLSLSLVLGLAPSPARAQTLAGTWESDVRTDDGRIHLQLRIEQSDDGVWMSGFSVEPGELSGIDETAAAGTARDVAFELVREAGTISLRGNLTDGRGAGTFTFSPSDTYRRELADLGFSDIPDKRLLLFATLDTTTDYVRGLRQLGYRSLDQEDLVRFVIHGVSLEYVRAMNGLGYTDIEPGQLIKLRIHGVSPEYVRDIRAALGQR